MSITSYGKKVLAGEDVVPHDPEGYIKTFKTKIPDADPLILTYLTESVQTFRTGNLLASSTMLGVASEAAFNILFDAITKVLSDPKKQSFEKLVESTRTKTKFDEMMKVIEQIKKEFPQEVKENISSELDGIFNLIRYQRNDTGHPTGSIITRDQMFVSLRLFIIYCSKVYAIVNWLNSKQL
jgi:RNAse (barnase) inhibitor barstar